MVPAGQFEDRKLPIGDQPSFRLDEPNGAETAGRTMPAWNSENGAMREEEIYRALGTLLGKKEWWKAAIADLISLLDFPSVKVRARALFLLGEAGLAFPAYIGTAVPVIAEFTDSTDVLLRQRAVNALGRIGRGCFSLIEPYWEGLFRFAEDEAPQVRHSFLWASENIAVNSPDRYASYLSVYAAMLHDPDDRVRMEAPEMFRVIAKHCPLYVQPYMELLRAVSKTDPNRVVRIHCIGACKAAGFPEPYNSKITSESGGPI